MTASTPPSATRADARPSGRATTALPLETGSIALQAWARIGLEAVRFAWDRLEHGMQAQQRLLASKSLEDLHTAQAEFLAATRQHHAAATRRMLDLLAGATIRGLSATGSKRDYDDVPL